MQMDNPGKRITQKLKPNFIGTLIKHGILGIAKISRDVHLIHSLFQIASIALPLRNNNNPKQ